MPFNPYKKNTQGKSANAAIGAGGYGGFKKPKSDASKRVQSDSSAGSSFRVAKAKPPIPRSKPNNFGALGGPKTTKTAPIVKAAAKKRSPFGHNFDIGGHRLKRD